MKFNRLGIKLLFFTLIQSVLTIVFYDWFRVYKLSHGGVIGSSLQQAHPLIWVILGIEIVLSILLSLNIVVFHETIY